MDAKIMDKLLNFIAKIITHTIKIPLVKAALRILKNLFLEHDLLTDKLDLFFQTFFRIY